MSKLKVSAIHDPDNDNLAIGVDNAGNVGIGTTSPTSNLTVSSSTQYTGLHLRNGTNTSAKLIGFASGNDGGGLTLATGGTDDIKLLSGTGLSFNGGSNYLDDYEEGTYTTTANNGVTLYSDSDTISYTKIGNLVFVGGQVRVSNWNSESAMSLNMPFNCKAESEGGSFSVGSVRLYNVDVHSDNVWGVCQMSGGSNDLEFMQVRDQNSASTQHAWNDGYYMFGITYRTE